MYRIATARVAGTRSLSTAAPTPPPPAPSGVPFGRFLLFGTTVTSAGLAVRMHTNDEFRAYVDTKLPGSSAALAKITGADYAIPASAETESTWPRGSTLPPHFETVPEILSKIGREEEKSEKVDERLTPTQRAAAYRTEKNTTSPASVETSNLSEKEPEKPAVSEVVKTTESMTVLPTPETPPPAPPTAKIPESTPKPVAAPVTVKKETSPEVPQAKPPADYQDAKAKIKRVFGKPSENDTSPFAKKSEVINSSVYKKPNFSKSTSSKGQTLPPAELAEKAVADVEALRRDLENQAQWDAVRIQKAVYAQVVEDKKAAAKEAAEMSRKHAVALERVKEEAVKNTQRVIEIRTREIEARTAERRDKELKEMLATREAHLRTELEVELFEREREQTVARERALGEAKARVSALASHFDQLLEHNKMSQEAAQTSAAAFSLCDAIATNRPFSRQLDIVSAKTELAAAVAASIPRSAQEAGIPTTQELQCSFPKVSRRGLGAALVPVDSSGTIWGHILGAVMSRLKIRMFEAPLAACADFDDPTSDEDRIRQAQAYVEAGRLDKATTVLNGVEAPLSATILSDWLADARARCAANLAARILFADATIAQVALSTTPPKHPAA